MFVIADAIVRSKRCYEVEAEAGIALTLKYAPDRVGGGGRRTGGGD